MNKVVDKYRVSVKDNLDRILTYDDLIKEKNSMESKFNNIIDKIKEDNMIIKEENKLLKEDYKLLKRELEKLKNKN
jgi:predicted nuclease with TOPRIM domain